MILDDDLFFIKNTEKEAVLLEKIVMVYENWKKSFNQSPKTLRMFFYMLGVGGNGELTCYSKGGIEFLL